MSNGNEGRKDDAGKPDWTLLPWGPVGEIVKVLTWGARVKYKDLPPDNWKFVKDAMARYEAAFFRHVVAYLEGERLDPDSGLPHLAHAGCCLLFTMWLDENKKE